MDIEVDDLAQLDDVADWSQLISRLVEIAQRRSQLLAEMRQALLENDIEKVVQCASILCGLVATEVKQGAPNE